MAPVTRSRALPPLSLYVHFPWCVRKCPYCDFNSHTLHGALPRGRTTSRRCCATSMQRMPSLGARAAQHIHRRRHAEPVLARGPRPAARRRARACSSWPPTPRSRSKPIPARSSAGASPAIAPPASTGCRSACRASIPSSCERWAASTRRRTRARAVEELQAAGFDNFNLDLMYGLPRQTLAQALADVRARARAARRRTCRTTS